MAQQAAAVGSRCESWRWRTYAWVRIGPRSCVRACFTTSQEAFSVLSHEETPVCAPCRNVHRRFSAPRIIHGALAARGCVGACLFFSCASSQFSCLASSHPPNDRHSSGALGNNASSHLNQAIFFVGISPMRPLRHSSSFWGASCLYCCAVFFVVVRQGRCFCMFLCGSLFFLRDPTNNVLDFQEDRR